MLGLTQSGWHTQTIPQDGVRYRPWIQPMVDIMSDDQLDDSITTQSPL